MSIYNNLLELLNSLQIAPAPAAWAASWPGALSSFPGDGSKVDFLSDEYALGANRLLELPGPMLDDLRAALALIRGRLDLSLLAWLWHYTLIVQQVSGEGNPDRWPYPEAAMGPLAGMFPLATVLSGLPSMQQIYRERRLPADLLQQTLSEVRVEVEFYARQYGRYGLHTYILGWLLHHLQGRLFQLGRLNLMAGVFPGGVRTLRRRSTGEVCALAEDGVRFRADGHIAGTNGLEGGEGAWVSSLREDEQSIEGNPIGPHGLAMPQRVRLLKSEWQTALTAGDAVIEVHIPFGGKLHHEQCMDSYRQACAFFPAHYPDRRFRALTCWSWLLDPQLQQLLPASANIVRFQQDYCLYPVLSGDDQIYECVYDNKRPNDLSALPADTTLRRSIRAYLLQGGQLHAGGGFILLDEGRLFPGA